MYKNIINDLDVAIKQHKESVFEKSEMTENEKHYFIQGLEVAKQIVNNAEEIAIEEIPYETFEDTVRSLKENLDRYDMEVIIEDIFMDDDLVDNEDDVDIDA